MRVTLVLIALSVTAASAAAPGSAPRPLVVPAAPTDAPPSLRVVYDALRGFSVLEGWRIVPVSSESRDPAALARHGRATAVLWADFDRGADDVVLRFYRASDGRVVDAPLGTGVAGADEVSARALQDATRLRVEFLLSAPDLTGRPWRALPPAPPPPLPPERLADLRPPPPTPWPTPPPPHVPEPPAPLPGHAVAAVGEGSTVEVAAPHGRSEGDDSARGQGRTPAPSGGFGPGVLLGPSAVDPGLQVVFVAPVRPEWAVRAGLGLFPFREWSDGGDTVAVTRLQGLLSVEHLWPGERLVLGAGGGVAYGHLSAAGGRVRTDGEHRAGVLVGGSVSIPVVGPLWASLRGDLDASPMRARAYVPGGEESRDDLARAAVGLSLVWHDDVDF